MTCPTYPSLTPFSRLPSIDQLDGCLEYRLTLLVAPAESGKTARLKEWVATRLHPCGLLTAWLNLVTADNLSATFIADLISALTAGGFLEIEDSSLLDGSSGATTSLDPNIHDSITDLINPLDDIGAGIIIFDNYQVVLSPVIHRGVQYLIDYLPERIHLVIASRSEPPLNLGRYRVRRQMKAYGL